MNELSRSPVVDYTGRTILITGGTGSFGGTMVRHLLETGVEAIRIFSRDEAKQHYMRVEFDDPRLQFYIGDVRDERSVRAAVDGCDLVFHAAALKQVPSCEFFPVQAVMTNVLGSANLVEAAKASGVESLVCLSTDKAVMPVNAMGMTKALMEKVAQAGSRSAGKTTVCSTRYGNVLYSRGSVVPLFVDQIKQGLPLTITNPAMTRFLMPLHHCVDLVEFAFFNANQGDVFVRKAASSTIGNLAEATSRLFGSTNATKVIGVRHGEKLHETLASADELQRATDMGDYYRVAMDSRDLNYAEYFEKGDPGRNFEGDYDSHTTDLLSVEEIMALLESLPEVKAELDAWSRR